MPKKSTGMVGGKGKTNPTVKEATPNKAPSMKANSLPTQIKTPNMTAAMPNPRLTRPKPLAPRTPRI